MPALNLCEQFTRTFDVFPFEQPPGPQTATTGFGATGTAAETKKLASSTTGSVYGFGSASLRFQNEVYGCHLPYGKVNKAVIELAHPEPVGVTELAATAPSRMLPEYAAKFKPELGRTFATTVSRDAPPGKDGAANYWVQPKDTEGLFPGGKEPEIFSMAAPRGAGPSRMMHEAPNQLLTPAERREALVFDKCHQRARLALRKATGDACQLTRVMQQRFPTGVLGVEGPGCKDSVIYAQDRMRREESNATRDAQRAVRFENILTKRDTQLDYRLLTHDHTTTAVDKMFQRKAHSSLGNRGQATPAGDPLANFEYRPSGATAGDGGFRSNQEKPLRPHNPARAQALHNVNTRGKAYDLLSGAKLTVLPTGGEWEAQPRRLHPSNLAMPHRGGTAPTLVGPIPDAHTSSWQPPSPQKSPSRNFLK